MSKKELFEEFEGLMHELNHIWFKVDGGKTISKEELDLIKRILKEEK